MDSKGINRILPPGSLHKIIESLGIKIHNGDKIICPFHADTDPSLKINKNNTWKCFGCQKKGTAYQFLKAYRKSDPEDNLQYLANVCEIDLESLKQGECESIERQARSCIVNGKLYETVHKNGISRYVYVSRKDEKDRYVIDYVNEVIDAGIIYKPANGAEVEKGMVRLPSEITTDSYTVSGLLKDIQAFIHEFADMSADFERICAYYVLLSWLYDRVEQINYLSFMGDTGTGKSRCQLTVGILCLCPILLNGGTSSAAMYRLADKWKGTLIIDEADFNESSETQDVVKLLNCGNERSKPVAKCDKNDPNKIDFFDAYSPKIIARRFPYKDKALESRMLTYITSETERKDILVCIPPDFWDRAERLRNRLLNFRLQEYWLVENPKDNIFQDLDIEPRLKQANTAIGIILRRFPQCFEDLKQFLKGKSDDLLNERSMTREGTLIHAFAGLVLSGIKVITPTDLSNAMNELAGSEDFDRYKFTSRGIGSLLRAMDFEVKPVKFEGRTVRRVRVEWDNFVKHSKRYGYVVTQVTLYRDTSDFFIFISSGASEAELQHCARVPIQRNPRNLVTDLVEWVDSNDYNGNYGKALEAFPEEQIIHALAVGEIYQHKPDWIKVLK